VFVTRGAGKAKLFGIGCWPWHQLTAYIGFSDVGVIDLLLFRHADASYLLPVPQPMESFDAGSVQVP
jgi:hypothetical protein